MSPLLSPYLVYSIELSPLISPLLLPILFLILDISLRLIMCWFISCNLWFLIYSQILIKISLNTSTYFGIRFASIICIAEYKQILFLFHLNLWHATFFFWNKFIFEGFSCDDSLSIFQSILILVSGKTFFFNVVLILLIGIVMCLQDVVRDNLSDERCDSAGLNKCLT